jgi:hypothetical protein
MIDKDTMTEYFEFTYSHNDGHNTTESTTSKTWSDGVSLYENGGVLDTFVAFLVGAGYNVEAIVEALEDL